MDVQGLQVIIESENDISTWNFVQLKAELEQVLSDYEKTVYTDDNIKDAKNDKATLNKAKKKVEDRRKEYRAKCLEPYEAIEPQVKELVQMIERQRLAIDDMVKEYTERKKQEKEKAVRAYYDQKAVGLGDYAERLYPRLLDPKWLNATTPQRKYETGILEAVQKSMSDIESIKVTGSLFVDTMLDVYVETGSLEKALQKQAELEEASRKAVLPEKAAEDGGDHSGTPAASGTDFLEELGRLRSQKIQTGQQAAQDTGKTLRLLELSPRQQAQVEEFLKAIGVPYEWIV